MTPNKKQKKKQNEQKKCVVAQLEHLLDAVKKIIFFRQIFRQMFRHGALKIFMAMAMGMEGAHINQNTLKFYGALPFISCL